MTGSERFVMSLDLEPGTDPIRGLVTAADGEPHEFVGWLGLAGEIERLIVPAAESQDSTASSS